MSLSVSNKYSSKNNNTSKKILIRKKRREYIKIKRRARLLAISASRDSNIFDEDIDSFLSDLNTFIDVTVEDIDVNRQFVISNIDNLHQYLTVLPSLNSMNMVKEDNLNLLGYKACDPHNGIRLLEYKPIDDCYGVKSCLKSDYIHCDAKFSEYGSFNISLNKCFKLKILDFITDNMWFSVAILSLFINIILMFIIFFQKKQLSLLLEKLT